MEVEDGVRILFRFYSDILDQEMVETLWGLPLEGEEHLYRIDSIPFYAPFVATDDVVLAEWDDEEEQLTYRETIQPSGNSVVWVVITNDDADIDAVRKTFFEMDCLSEALSGRFFAMEIKAETNYLKVKDKLKEYKSKKVLDYVAPYLSEKHQY